MLKKLGWKLLNLLYITLLLINECIVEPLTTFYRTATCKHKWIGFYDPAGFEESYLYCQNASCTGKIYYTYEK